MVILHICAVENKMSNGATVAALNHINEQAKSGDAHIMVCHVKNEKLPWDDAVEVITYEELQTAIVAIDLVVFHEIYYATFFKIAKMLRRDNKPYVVVAHGGLTKGAQSQRRLPKMIVNFGWAKSFIRGAKAIHFLSQREYKTSVTWNKKYLISPNGVRLPERVKTFDDTEIEGLRLIYIGRINLFYKGLDVLCEACAIIAQQMREKKIEVYIYGPREGEDYEKLQTLITTLRIEDIIKVHDGVFGEEKEKTMLAADIFIQPSRSEGQPMGILDAMAIGLPVIVTPGTTFDELVEKQQCGWTTQSKRDLLAQTILRGYEERAKLQNKSQNARACVKELFQWEYVAKQTIRKYQQLLEK